MRYLPLVEALTAFEDLFDTAQHDMFKAEVLQDYIAVDDCPSLRAWLIGDKQKAKELGKKDENIVVYRNKCLASPATIMRVHLVKSPYTPYLEWEIVVCYKDSLIAHGAEAVLLLDKDDLLGVKLPAGDFWMFDNTRVLQWKYDVDTGKTTGAQLWDEAAGDEVTVEYFRQLRKLFLSKATPVI